MLSLSHSLHLEFKEHLPSLFWVRQQAHILSFHRYLLFLQTHPKLSFFYFCLRKFFKGICNIILSLLVCKKLWIVFLFLNQKWVTILALILRVAMRDCTALATTAAVSSVFTVSINFASFFCLSVRVFGSTYILFYLAWSSTWFLLILNRYFYAYLWIRLRILVARFFLPLQRMMRLIDLHSGSELRSIYYYFFLGGIVQLYLLLKLFQTWSDD